MVSVYWLHSNWITAPVGSFHHLEPCNVCDQQPRKSCPPGAITIPRIRSAALAKPWRQLAFADPVIWICLMPQSISSYWHPPPIRVVGTWPIKICFLPFILFKWSWIITNNVLAEGNGFDKFQLLTELQASCYLNQAKELVSIKIV